MYRFIPLSLGKTFFATNDEPNLPDHDNPNPGYLLCCSGYQRLVVNERQLDVVDSVYTDDDRNDKVSNNGFLLEPSEEAQSSEETNVFHDKLGWAHYLRYMNGPTKLVLRAVKFSPSNAMHHVYDILPHLEAEVRNGVGIAFLKSIMEETRIC